MAVWVTLLAFGNLVAVLAALNYQRTRGRSCCAPADPADDLRMRGSFQSAPIERASQD